MNIKYVSCFAEDEGDGTFLVRESSSASGDFVLSVLYQNDVIHYQIRKHGEDAFYSIGKTIFYMFCSDFVVYFYNLRLLISLCRL